MLANKLAIPHVHQGAAPGVGPRRLHDVLPYCLAVLRQHQVIVAVVTNPAKLLPRLLIGSGDILRNGLAGEQIVQTKAQYRRLIANLKNTVRLAGDSEKTALSHQPIDMLVQAVLVIFKASFGAAPKVRPVLEGQCASSGVSVVVEQIVVQQRHRLHIGTVHDVVAPNRIPFLAVAF